MTNTLDLRVSLQALGDTTIEEAETAVRRLAEALADRPEVMSVRPLIEPAPWGAKAGGKVAALGVMLLQAAPTVIEVVLGLIRDLLARTGTVPTKVTVEREGGKVAVEFDPRRTSSEDIAALAKRLAGDLDAS